MFANKYLHQNVRSLFNLKKTMLERNLEKIEKINDYLNFKEDKIKQYIISFKDYFIKFNNNNLILN